MRLTLPVRYDTAERRAPLVRQLQATTAIDPLLPVLEPAVMTTLWRAQTPQPMGALVAALFGVSGLLLAALGTYGVLAYLVSARAREFGIRQALGARPRDVQTMVLRDGVVLAVAGLALGAALSVGALQALHRARRRAVGAAVAGGRRAQLAPRRWRRGCRCVAPPAFIPSKRCAASEM